MDLDETRDEEAIRLRDAMARNAGKISYTYDLGACWEHEIALEQTLPRDRGRDYPVCVAYKGDSPVDYWCEDDPEEREPLDLAEVNRKLAALGEAEE
jgi:Plasmid pRiA4b ORF-3-like protein